MYLAVSEESISAVLLAERGMKQIPINFVGRALKGTEVEYPKLEKLTLALVYAARWLWQYFQAHSIQILTDKPIKEILARPEKSGRIAKWAIELGEHDIEFKGRNSVKGHVLADFLAETPTTKSKETQKARNEGLDPENTWKLYTDGASSSDGCRAGLILVNLEGREYTYALRFEFETTNNEAEYEVLLAGLRIAEEMKIEDLDIFVDFQLVANQVKRLFEARQLVIKSILRENKKDTQKFQELLNGTWKVVTNIIKKEGENGMAPIREHLLFGNLPDDSQKARKIRIKAPQYRMIDNDLYRKSYLSPWLRCVGPTQAKSIIEKIHQDTDIEMSNMPNTLIDTEEAKAGNDIYNVSMAFLPMGNRHCETTATRTRRCKLSLTIGSSSLREYSQSSAKNLVYFKHSPQFNTPKRTDRLKSPIMTFSREWSED
ncbi:reverse transcriptase domain-containing protein [Tanacetum coccineum]